MSFPHSYIKLTDAELAIVQKEAARYALEGKMKKRNHLLILFYSHSGKNYQEIAELRRPPWAESTVRNWIYLYRKNGLKPFVHPDVFP